MLTKIYRPRKFSEVIGNRENVTLIKTMVATGKLPRFMYLHGIPGISKTTLAYIIIKAINCKNPKDGEPCGECDSCRSIDVTLYENGEPPSNLPIYTFDLSLNQDDSAYINNIAHIINSKSFVQQKRKKVILLEELHCVRKPELQQMLLKTLENLPKDVHVIMCTHEPHHVAQAIRERADIEIALITPPRTELIDHLMTICKKEKLGLDKKQVEFIAALSNNNPRESLNKLNAVYLGGQAGINAIIMSEKAKFKLFLNYFEAIKKGSISLIENLESLDNKPEFIKDLKNFLKMVIKLRTFAEVTHLEKDLVREILETMQSFELNDLYETLEKIMDIKFISSEDADTKLLVIGFNLNKRLYQSLVKPDNQLADYKKIIESKDKSIETILENLGEHTKVGSVGEL